MRMKTIKTAAEAVLAGVRVELELVDGNMQGIRFTDANGSLVRVVVADTYPHKLGLQVPAPPETQTVHRVQATVGSENAGLSIVMQRDFEKSEQAEDARRALENDGARDVKVVEVEGLAEPSDIASHDPF